MNRVRVILAVAAILVASAVVMALYRHREPGYQGRSLSEWADGGMAAYLSNPDLSHNVKWQIATNAVSQMGSNSLPVILGWAAAKDSRFKARLIAWLEKHPAFHWHIRSAYARHWNAQWGLAMLGDKAKAAWPVLIQVSFDKDPFCRMRAMDYLTSAKADKETLLPVLRRLLKDPDARVIRNAAVAFHFAFPEDAEAAGVYKLYPDMKPLSPSETNRVN